MPNSRNDPAYAAALARFPKLSPELLEQRLALPEGRVRVVLDTDAKNEIDDQPTIAWALLSQDVLEIEGMYAVPFSFGLWQESFERAGEIKRSLSQPKGADAALVNTFAGWLEKQEKEGPDALDPLFNPPGVGMERSYQEIVTIYQKMGFNPEGQVFRGSERFLPSISEPVDSPAARHLIERAMAPSDRPLYVLAIGALTNVASALLMEPRIAERIVVVWTASYPSVSKRTTHSLNLEQDMIASQLLFDCGVPLVYLPGYQVGAQLKISQPEMELWVKGRGEIGDYLYELYMNNPLHGHRTHADFFGRTWIMWDLITVAWLIDHQWVPSDLMPSPILTDDRYYQDAGPGRHLMREAYAINRDAIFRDLLGKLDAAARGD
ncbi:MAG: nucleoside hydrolase [Meiothermus sp.]|nr:nucleoside hydrolase [Meiothermus sp.]